MPKAKRNAHWLEWLQEMRDEEDRDSNKYMIYNKAFNSLKKETKEYTDADSLLAVKFIGPGIVERLKKKVKENGGVATMEEIPSNLPSPAKRKRASGAASSSEPKRRGRPSKQPLFESDSDDDDDVMPAPKRHSGLIPGRLDQPGHPPAPYYGQQVYVPPAFPPPDHPLGIPPHMHQQHVNPNLPVAHHLPAHPLLPHNQYYYGYPPLPARPYQQPAVSEPAHVNPPPPPQGAPPPPPFKFNYIDSYRKRVRSCDMAEVDIHDNALWYKVCFLDSDLSKAHPVRQHLRPVSYDALKGKMRERLVEAWVKDQDVEQYNLHTAPGFTEGEAAMDLQTDLRPSATTFQAASHPRVHQMDGSSLTNKSGGMPKGSQEDSLADLLKAENKKKRNTIDPTRVTDIDKEWDVRRGGGASGSGKGVVKFEMKREKEDATPEDSMRQRLAMAAMARHQLSSGVAGPSSVSSSQPAPQNSTANPVFRRTKTLPNHPHDAQNMLRVSTREIPSLFEFDPASPIPSVPSIYLAHPAPQEHLRRTVTTPVAPYSTGPAPQPKPKPKGKVRGRVSEFAPALPAVDEFDVDLDRQAVHQRIRTEQHASGSGSASHASADLIDSVTDLTIEAAPSFPAFQPIFFPPGSYDISLVLDNREVKSHKHRDHIVLELRKRGVDVEQRSLSLGDVLWIAKWRYPIAGAEVNECVLDYILERKRLDDLCGSIKEGRFHEQKFRLTNTGLKVFYLIEDYDVEKNREVFGVQIDTARSSTQVVDGFIVKETKKLSFTIDYLAAMHETILEMYQNKPLNVIPPHLIKRHSYMALQKHLRLSHPTVGYLTSYACFDKLNSKSANITTRDLLAQMLLCVKGLSAEKVAVIIESYPTMRSLWDAFRVADTIERDGKKREVEEAAATASQGKGKGRKKKSTVPEAKAMLCDLEATGRKRIGPVLSANLYRLMRANAYED